LVVTQDAQANRVNACNANDSPYIDQCEYDQAGIILQHIYGVLNSPDRGQLKGFSNPVQCPPKCLLGVPPGAIPENLIGRRRWQRKSSAVVLIYRKGILNERAFYLVIERYCVD
jgi:hypothetical protein